MTFLFYFPQNVVDHHWQFRQHSAHRLVQVVHPSDAHAHPESGPEPHKAAAADAQPAAAAAKPEPAGVSTQQRFGIWRIRAGCPDSGR